MLRQFKVTDVMDNLNIKNDIATLNIYGDIVASEADRWYDEDTCPESVSKFMKAVGEKELHIHINSGGGSAFAGIAIYNIIRNRTGKNVVHIDSIAASAASVIALAGDEIIMPKGSIILVHKPWTMACGNSDELRKQAEFLDNVCNSLLEIYKDNLKNEDDYEKIKEYVDAETCLNSEACAELFKKIVVDDSLDACACARSESYSRYKNFPKNLKIEEDEKVPLHKSDDEDKKKEIDKMLMEFEIEEMLKEFDVDNV